MSLRKRKPGNDGDESSDVANDPAKEEQLLADYRLAQRCAAGEVAAWEEIYAQCHDRLLASIRRMLGGHQHDFSLVDEIAARVWYALVENDGELLLRYDPDRGATLTTFMRILAKDMLRRHFRSERRRYAREQVAAGRQSHHQQSDSEWTEGMLNEFLATLSPGEQAFCHQCLLNAPGDVGPLAYSQTNIWQRTSRLYKRLMKFLGNDSDQRQ